MTPPDLDTLSPRAGFTEHSSHSVLEGPCRHCPAPLGVFLFCAAPPAHATGTAAGPHQCHEVVLFLRVFSFETRYRQQHGALSLGPQGMPL